MQWISSQIMSPTQTAVCLTLSLGSENLHVSPVSLARKLWLSPNLWFQQSQPNSGFMNVSWETKLWAQIGFLLKKKKKKRERAF